MKVNHGPCVVCGRPILYLGCSYCGPDCNFVHLGWSGRPAPAGPLGAEHRGEQGEGREEDGEGKGRVVEGGEHPDPDPDAEEPGQAAPHPPAYEEAPPVSGPAPDPEDEWLDAAVLKRLYL